MPISSDTGQLIRPATLAESPVDGLTLETIRKRHVPRVESESARPPRKPRPRDYVPRHLSTEDEATHVISAERRARVAVPLPTRDPGAALHAELAAETNVLPDLPTRTMPALPKREPGAELHNAGDVGLLAKLLRSARHVFRSGGAQ